MITLDWGDANESILVWTFSDNWTAEDFYLAIEKAETILGPKEKPVHIIVDAQQGFKPPKNLIALSKVGLKRGPTPVKLVVVIAKSRFLQNIYGIVAKMYPGSLKVHFVNNANEAYQLIEEFDEQESLNYKSLLYVDDNKINCDLVEKILDQEPYRVVTTLHGQDGLNLMQAHHFDIVILDYNLPEITGLEVLKTMRATETYAKTPVLILTADVDIKSEFLDAGATDFMLKPIRRQTLIDKLSQFDSLELV